jgi:tetratricopeptide (TPR) repeat protein/predicted transcriptional regulator
MTTDGVTLSEQLETVAHRVEFIDLLSSDGPLATRDIVEAVTHSRSTVTRALRELREVDLVEKTDSGYVTTVAATLAADQYHRYETASKAILTSKELLAAIPSSAVPPVDLLIDADTIHAEAEPPVRPLEVVSERVGGADTVRAYLPTLVNTHLLRTWHRTVTTEAMESEAIFDPDLLTVLKGQYPHLLSEMAATDDFVTFSQAGPPYGLFLTTRSDTTAVSVIVYENGNAVRGVVINESDAAVEWARETFDRLKRESTDTTAELELIGTAVADGMSTPREGRAVQRVGPEGDSLPAAAGHGLPLELETEGFVRLSSEYFDTHREAKPDVSWRTGFTLAEVRAGHPVDRLDENGRNLTHRLVDQLRNGDDYVVIGPPGSGKSTTCMAVACEWYERGIGPVLYRERGNSDHFTSTALLEAYLRQVDDRALVVVEDAVREEAAGVFQMMQVLDDAQNVTFLLDARTHDWQNPDTFAFDVRQDRYRRTAIEQITVPPLDERECERIIDHFTDLADTDSALSGAELLALVNEGAPAAGAEDGTPAGELLIVQHYLTQRHDPTVSRVSEMPSALDATVRQTYQRLVETGPQLAVDLAVLTNLLNAAGIPVASEYLYTIVPEHQYTELEEAIAFQEGQLLFDLDSPRSGTSTTYRPPHEAWSLRFLKRMHEFEPTSRARERFGRCVSRLLALADDEERRQRIKRHRGGRTPHLHRIEADPQRWADELAARIFHTGQADASIAPLFGETAGDTTTLPEACSDWTDVMQAYWRGKMNLLYGDLERAEREFHLLREKARSADSLNERGASPSPASTAPSTVETLDERIAGERETRHEYWDAVSFSELGAVARKRGDLETATEYHERSLTLRRQIDDRHGEPVALKNLGSVAYKRGDLEAAEDYCEESLTLFRDIGDHHGEAMTELLLGNIAIDRDDRGVAEERYEESLAGFREVGDRRREAIALLNIGAVARKRGDLETAAEYHERSLVICREISYRHGEATALRDLGTVAHEQGELATAEEYLEESLSLFSEIGNRQNRAHTLADFGVVAHKRGESETAEEYLTESLRLCREIGDSHGEAKALLELGVVAHARDELELARSRFTDATALCVENGFGEAATAFTKLVDTCERQGCTDAAVKWCRKAIEFAEETDRPTMRSEFADKKRQLRRSVE